MIMLFQVERIVRTSMLRKDKEGHWMNMSRLRIVGKPGWMPRITPFQSNEC
jgi:hypothetical protein